MKLQKEDAIIPGARYHNFKDFMNFPDLGKTNLLFKQQPPLLHPYLANSPGVFTAIRQKDVMLHFPYHFFNPVIDLLREAAIDPSVTSIRITCYRLAEQSKIINALINAVRNGKHVTVMLELSARFDEEANLEWKERLEDEGVKVLIGMPNMKVHAKVCVIRKKINDRTTQYGFVSTGNLNEKTARVYVDHCLLTSNQKIMADANRIFNYFEQPKNGEHWLRQCRTIIPSPLSLRKVLHKLIHQEIRNAKRKKPAQITLKMNSFSDQELIIHLYEAAKAGVEVRLIIRGIFCMLSYNPKFRKKITAISIVDEYLEHARVWVFHNGGKEKVYISSADWMVRNLDHRVEVTCPITEETVKQELKDILNIQLSDNVKARWLDNDLNNEYVTTRSRRKIRSQLETYQYLYKKTLTRSETGRN